MNSNKIKCQIFTMRLDEPTITWLKEVADRKGLSVSALVRMWTLEQLSKEPAPKSGEWIKADE